MSDTPRSDAVLLSAVDPVKRAYEFRLLSESLERENARQAEEIGRLRSALERAREWGLNHIGLDSRVALDLSRWIDGGMVGPLPAMPDYLTPAQPAAK